ncbi:MAG: GAF domain-containing sensor histidine kinase [Steroidobacteraceae bacterium]
MRPCRGRLATSITDMATMTLANDDLQLLELQRLQSLQALSAPQPERLWAASARASRMLLEAPDVMAAMPQVLRELGEAAGVDRTALALAEIGPAGERWLDIKSEWLADGIDIEYGDAPRTWTMRKSDCFCDQLKTGRSVYVCNEQFNDTSIAIDFAKSSMIVPFLVDGEYLGVIGFDACRQKRQFDPAIISALEIAASVIGAALHREKLVETMRLEREQAAEQRLSEIANANAALRSNLQRLATAPDPYNFIGHMLLETAHQLDAAAGTIVMLNAIGDEWRLMAHVRKGNLEEPPFPLTMPHCEVLNNELHRLAREPLYFEIAAMNKPAWPGVYEYHQREGHRCVYKMPLVFGDNIVGFMTLCFMDLRPLASERIELLITLAQQATLAIALKRLAIAGKDAAVLAERNRIGREIHDGLAQSFTGILMQLGAAEELAEGSPLTPLLQRIGDIARDGLNEARRSVLALRPNEARPGGLELALKQLAERSTITGRVTSSFEGEGIVTGLAPEREHALLRIAQEAVNNAVRHAQPSSVRIVLNAEDEFLVLRIIDDGCGMAQLPESAQHGFGLTNMRERAHAIGGLWQVDSQPGAGTHISVRVLRQQRS